MEDFPPIHGDDNHPDMAYSQTVIKLDFRYNPPDELPLRKSKRKVRSTLLREWIEDMEAKVLPEDDDKNGRRIVKIPDSDNERGIQADRGFLKLEFEVEFLR